MKNIGSLSMLGKNSKSIINSLKTLSEDFSKRDDSRNFADTMISEQKIAPSLAYSIAFPVNNTKGLSESIKAIPDIRQAKLSQIPSQIKFADENIDSTFNKLAPFLKNSNASPLAIGRELQKKGYNLNDWISYVNEHKDELDLKQSQSEQLKKIDSSIGTIYDWWLEAFTGTE